MGIPSYYIGHGSQSFTSELSTTAVVTSGCLSVYLSLLNTVSNGWTLLDQSLWFSHTTDLGEFLTGVADIGLTRISEAIVIKSHKGYRINLIPLKWHTASRAVSACDIWASCPFWLVAIDQDMISIGWVWQSDRPNSVPDCCITVYRCLHGIAPDLSQLCA